MKPSNRSFRNFYDLSFHHRITSSKTQTHDLSLSDLSHTHTYIYLQRQEDVLYREILVISTISKKRTAIICSFEDECLDLQSVAKLVLSRDFYAQKSDSKEESAREEEKRRQQQLFSQEESDSVDQMIRLHLENEEVVFESMQPQEFGDLMVPKADRFVVVSEMSAKKSFLPSPPFSLEENQEFIDRVRKNAIILDASEDGSRVSEGDFSTLSEDILDLQWKDDEKEILSYTPKPTSMSEPTKDKEILISDLVQCKDSEPQRKPSDPFISVSTEGSILSNESSVNGMDDRSLLSSPIISELQQTETNPLESLKIINETIQQPIQLESNGFLQEKSEELLHRPGVVLELLERQLQSSRDQSDELDFFLLQIDNQVRPYQSRHRLPDFTDNGYDSFVPIKKTLSQFDIVFNTQINKQNDLKAFQEVECGSQWLFSPNSNTFPMICPELTQSKLDSLFEESQNISLKSLYRFSDDIADLTPQTICRVQLSLPKEELITETFLLLRQTNKRISHQEQPLQPEIEGELLSKEEEEEKMEEREKEEEKRLLYFYSDVNSVSDKLLLIDVVPDTENLFTSVCKLLNFPKSSGPIDPLPLPIITRPQKKPTLQQQKGLCKGCGKPISKKKAKYCEYFTAFFCTPHCYKKKRTMIPSHVLTDWDTTKCKVSENAWDYLKAIFYEPIFDVMKINPTLYNLSQPLRTVWV